MTPEELEAFRGWCRTFEVPPHSLIMKALEHIDQQAASLDEAEALTKRNAELMNGYLARITELEAQIAALRKIAVYLYAELAFMKDRCEDRLVDECGDVWADYADIARRQLAEEHPEAFR